MQSTLSGPVQQGCALQLRGGGSAARAAGHRWQDAECEQQFVTGSQGCKRAGGGDSMSFSGESVCSAKTDDWWVICFALLSVWQGLV